MNPLIDKVVFRLSDTSLLKGVVIATLLWWCWTRRDGRLVDEKAKSAKTVAGILLAIILGRVLQVALPFRHRPMHDPSFSFILPDVFDELPLVGWSSLPSDHAVMFFAVVTAIWSYNLFVGVFAFIWTAIFICLPRVYFGFHWPTDILAGAAVGIAIMAVALRITLPEWLHSFIMKVQSCYPGWLYAGYFFLAYQIATLFEEIRVIFSAAAKLILGLDN